MYNKLKKAFNQIIFLYFDLKRTRISSFSEFIYRIIEFSLWVTVLYRLSRIIYLLDFYILRIPLRIVVIFIFKIMELLFGVAIRARTEIGPGFYIGHVGLIRIHPDVIIGKNCSLTHGVTIGTQGLGIKGVPIIGDNVFIGCGAKILGPVKIGNNVKIGANAVVVTDIPDNCTAVGVPAKIINNSNKRK